jgi:hypothetical protein
MTITITDRLVQNLSSNDADNVSKAMQESDVLLKGMSTTGVNRTVINRSSNDQQHQSPGRRMFLRNGLTFR